MNDEQQFHRAPQMVSNDAKACRVEFFCNNCFKPKEVLFNDGHYPVCEKCIAKRNTNRAKDAANESNRVSSDPVPVWEHSRELDIPVSDNGSLRVGEVEEGGRTSRFPRRKS